MRHVCALSGVLVLAAPLSAQVFENFEHGNEALYSLAGTTVDNFSLTAAAAHAGSFGGEFGTLTNPAWETRFDLTTAPGHRYFAHVRLRNSTSGRVYVGVGASTAGCWSAIFGPNTNEVQLQQNSAYGFVTRATAPVPLAMNTWYVVMLDWAADGTMIASVWDDTMTTQLAATAPFASGLTTPGGLAIRGFANGVGNTADIDDIGVVGGTCYPNCDGSTTPPVLNVLDFSCFLNSFAAGETYANCDASTTPPVLNVLDFSCFLNQFAAGCT